jgi:ABC-type uncharacterized transport system substrate-binding protein
MKEIGILTPAGAKTADFKAFEKALVKDLGWGANIKFTYRYANGDNSTLETYTNDLVNIPVDVIVASGTTAARTALRVVQQKGLQIPTVQAVGGEPVPSGSTLITGFHIDAADRAINRLRMLHANHGIKHATVLLDYTSETTARVFNAIDKEANKLKVRLKLLFARNSDDLAALKKRKSNPVVGSFIPIPSGMFFESNNRKIIASLVEKAKVPSIYPEREYKQAHKHKKGIKAHGHHIRKTYIEAAKLVNSILHNQPGAPLPAGGEAPRDDY